MKTLDFISKIDEVIESKRDVFISVSDKIWEFAETKFQEFQSAELLCQMLEAEGFSVERGVGGMKTAFVASFGTGTPVIGMLGEYDALSGLSQKQGEATKSALIEGGNGHGCGHNLYGASVLASVVAVKQYMEENNVVGTLRYYGCPAEEGGSGKTFMVREGLFEDVDCALTWHPGSFPAMFNASTLANFQVYFRFKGTASHAAASPHLGRSALDAVELMNVGVNYLREHMIPEARIHYAITNSGGVSPNVVQAESEVLYLIRSPKLAEVKKLYERVCNIARGAALMTETELEIVVDSGCSNYISNSAIGEIMYDNLTKFPLPKYDESEMAFGSEIMAKITDDDLQNTHQHIKKEYHHKISKNMREAVFLDKVLPNTETTEVLAGSTDVGDVSWVTPTAQFWGPCWVFGTPAHSWQMTSQGATSIAHKGMLHAGKVLAGTAIDILSNPEVLEKAKAELVEKREGMEYECPIPSEIAPPTK
ncbi:aminobenzoyl-glutamate utilization protein B [Bacillus mesophilus]|uniref:Amidohydrolase n=1 Tax=Bacillus mesophilus TaxID=1808955 RepID=A0A6M0QB01_9BACI|nr:M20 family metallopeptidase [Bacillus mesophilus]MBM7662937.1 aminobenzoyl-glutamate utilization protein B [Bacillus mesophilus]NEY73526.1 amidohydrolase [Bacillus mesophilus]